MGTVPVGRQLSACIFCGSGDISQEHLVADWALRGYAKSKRPNLGTAVFFSQTLVVTGSVDPVLKAGLTCHGCNGGWIKDMDDAAAGLLKPLIRAEIAITLTREEQIAAAAWLFKTTLVCDAAQNGDLTDLSPLREQFRRELMPPPSCVLMVGPAALPIAGRHRPFGLMPLPGKIVVHVIGAEKPVDVPIPGWRIMVGGIEAILGGARMPPVTAESLYGFAQLWPASESVTVNPRRLSSGG